MVVDATITAITLGGGAVLAAKKVHGLTIKVKNAFKKGEVVSRVKFKDFGSAIIRAAGKIYDHRGQITFDLMSTAVGFDVGLGYSFAKHVLIKRTRYRNNWRV